MRVALGQIDMVWIYNGEVLPTKNNAKKEGSDK